MQSNITLFGIKFEILRLNALLYLRNGKTLERQNTKLVQNVSVSIGARIDGFICLLRRSNVQITFSNLDNVLWHRIVDLFISLLSCFVVQKAILFFFISSIDNLECSIIAFFS